jgi:hypothetical protein
MKAMIVFLCIVAAACNGRHDELRQETQKKLGPYYPEPVVFKDTVWGTGTIETIVDGYDARTVNLWNTHEENREWVCRLPRGSRVDILLSFGEYYKIRSQRDHSCVGFCMKAWVKRD